jgi:hypothetical protein
MPDWTWKDWTLFTEVLTVTECTDEVLVEIICQFWNSTALSKLICRALIYALKSPKVSDVLVYDFFIECHQCLDLQVAVLENLEFAANIVWMFRTMIRENHPRKAEVISFVVEVDGSPAPGFAVLGLFCEPGRLFCNVKQDGINYIITDELLGFALPLTIGVLPVSLRRPLVASSIVRLDEPSYVNYDYILSFMNQDLPDSSRVLYAQVISHFTAFPSFVNRLTPEMLSQSQKSICLFEHVCETANASYAVNKTYKKLADNGFWPIRKGAIVTYLSPLLKGSTTVTLDVSRCYVGIVTSALDETQVRHTLVQFPSGKVSPPIVLNAGFEVLEDLTVAIDYAAKTFSVNSKTFPFPWGSMFRMAIALGARDELRMKISDPAAFDEAQPIRLQELEFTERQMVFFHAANLIKFLATSTVSNFCRQQFGRSQHTI